MGPANPIPCLSCPDCPIPGFKVTPGEAQGQHTWQYRSVGHLASDSRWMLRQPVCGKDTLAWWVPAGQAWSPALGVYWGSKAQRAPEGCERPEPAGRKGGGRGVKKGLPGRESRKGRGSEGESAAFPSAVVSTRLWAPHSGSLVTLMGNEDPQMHQG